MDDIKEGAMIQIVNRRDDLPPPPPKPKLVIETDINRGNPDAVGILDQMTSIKEIHWLGMMVLMIYCSKETADATARCFHCVRY